MSFKVWAGRRRSGSLVRNTISTLAFGTQAYTSSWEFAECIL